MSAIATIPFSKINLITKDVPGSDFNQNLYDLAVSAVAAGAKAETVGEYTHYYIQSKMLPLSVAKLVVQQGGNVTQYPLFIKLDSPEDITPVGLPNSIKYDENGDPDGQKTWNEWKGENYDITQLTNGYAVGTNASSGTDLAMSELTSVFDDLITVDEFNALKPVEEE